MYPYTNDLQNMQMIFEEQSKHMSVAAQIFAQTVSVHINRNGAVDTESLRPFFLAAQKAEKKYFKLLNEP